MSSVMTLFSWCSKRTWALWITFVCAMFFYLNELSFHQSGRLGLRTHQAIERKHINATNKQRDRSQKTFFELGVEIQANKVTLHRYQCLYEEALAPYRNVKGLKILEIGLGCGMPSGPGVSYRLWSNYFLDPLITFMDDNKNCGITWFEELKNNLTGDYDTYKLPNMFYGDMRKKEDLQQMADKHGPWDIIIDDGWHEPFCQIPALKSLLKHVNSGGIYFIEDLFMWGNKPENGTILKIAQLFALSIVQKQGKHLDPALFQDLFSEWDTPGIGERIERFICCEAICAITMKDF